MHYYLRVSLFYNKKYFYKLFLDDYAHKERCQENKKIFLALLIVKLLMKIIIQLLV